MGLMGIYGIKREPPTTPPRGPDDVVIEVEDGGVEPPLGRPWRRAGEALTRIARRAKYETAEEWLWDYISEGHTVSALCERIECTPHAFYQWLKKDPARKATFEDVRKNMAAHTLAEQGLQILDDASEDNIRTARERAGYRRFLARSANREVYGEGPRAQAPQINIGSLHLQALMAPAAELPKLAGLEIVQDKSE